MTTCIANHISRAIIRSEGNEIHTQDFHFFRFMWMQIFCKNDWIPKIYKHLVPIIANSENILLTSLDAFIDAHQIGNDLNQGFVTLSHLS